MPSVLHYRILTSAAAALAILSFGCGGRTPAAKTEQPKLVSRYQNLPPLNVPSYLKDSVLERCELGNAAPFAVSAFGLVANLHNTGDSFAGTAVREHIRSIMIKRGFGSKVHGTDNMQPEEILKDPRWAIVRVDALIPAGARKYQRFDVFVTALEGNNTSSLAHGDLYRTDLKINGANVQVPGYAVDVYASAEGPIFVNPAYAMHTGAAEPEVRNSLRQGIILNGGVAVTDRPLVLRLRTPQLSMARAIEHRLDQAFQDTAVAAAKDEALVAITVPQRYGEDWEHFAQVVLHTFLNSSPDFAVLKAKELAEEAVKPDAALLDISYCWEAIGRAALPFMAPLLSHEKPEVSFAAARAGAFIGDATSESVLMEIARSEGHSFQVTAVQTLAKLPASPAINQMLRALLEVESSLVRQEAYKALARAGDPLIITREVKRDDGQISFLLDIVPCGGKPIIYATRSGVPRIAVIGNRPQLTLPVMFSSADQQFTMVSDDKRGLVKVFYRGEDVPGPVQFLSSPDAVELIARLGGEGAPGEAKLRFSYCAVVALLQQLSERSSFHSQTNGKTLQAAFVLQDAPAIAREIEEAPAIPEQRAMTIEEQISQEVDARLSSPPAR